MRFSRRRQKWFQVFSEIGFVVPFHHLLLKQALAVSFLSLLPFVFCVLPLRFGKRIWQNRGVIEPRLVLAARNRRSEPIAMFSIWPVRRQTWRAYGETG